MGRAKCARARQSAARTCRERGCGRVSTMARIVLVDGVGNGVYFDHDGEATTVVLPSGRAFEKTGKVHEGLAVYRLIGAGKPKIRHIYHKLTI